MESMIRLADYVIQTLSDHGTRHIFMVTGGGAMHLNDAIGREHRLQYVCNHHEQASAMAAEAYARVSNRTGVVNVTTGPGGINALNGVFGAWTDSIPLVVISGQVKRETCMGSYDMPDLRQLGDQEVDIIRMVKGITKYAVLISDPNTIGYHLKKALHLASHGRPGPCWIDIPIDVQGARIDPAQMKDFEPELMDPAPLSESELADVCVRIRQKCEESIRPVILSGSGIRTSGSRDLYLQLLDHWKIPVTTAWGAHDNVWNDHPMFVGRPSSLGDRAGNFAVQNSDFLLVLGSRLNIRQVSYNWKNFAREAFKVVVDIDAAELNKPTVTPDLPVHADLNKFLRGLLALPPLPANKTREGWLNWCIKRKDKYPVVLPEYWQGKDAVNPYCFVETLFQELEGDDVVVCGDGTACVTTFQAANIKRDQRLFTNSGSASMGYDLPAAIGACFARGGKRVICLAGDGSIQMNLQELQTIATHKLPVKIFILNNRGYHSIRQTQQNFFPDNVVGCGNESGLGFPDFSRLAEVYGFPYFQSRNHSDLKTAVTNCLSTKSAVICEIMLDLGQQFAPKLVSKKLPDGRMISPPLEDMSPFLDREEFRDNLLIPEQIN